MAQTPRSIGRRWKEDGEGTPAGSSSESVWLRSRTVPFGLLPSGLSSSGWACEDLGRRDTGTWQL